MEPLRITTKTQTIIQERTAKSFFPNKVKLTITVKNTNGYYELKTQSVYGDKQQ